MQIIGQHNSHPSHGPRVLTCVFRLLRLLPACGLLRSPTRLLRSLRNICLLHSVVSLRRT